MSFEIEVEWRVSCPSGLTYIELSDLGVGSPEDWESLSDEAKCKLIDEYLYNNEGTIVPRVYSIDGVDIENEMKYEGL